MIEGAHRRWPGFKRLIREELAFIVVAGTLFAFQLFADDWLAVLETPLEALLLFAWIFLAMLWASFGVVRHVDALAELLVEPYGTLILTLAVIGMEVALIAAVMLTGEGAPTLARDTMFAVLMIVLNGLVGAALLLGALRHTQQDYNLQGARAYLAVMLPLAVFALVLPKFTRTTPDPTYSPVQALFFAVVTALLYGIFLGIQTGRHRSLFVPTATREDSGEIADESEPHHGPIYSAPYHGVLLLLTLLPIILLSKRFAKLVDFGIVQFSAPVALGGVVVALLVLTPEGLAALSAARDNRLQRSVNLLLGSGLATIGLTVPAVLAISLFTGRTVTLGLDDATMVLLLLTLIVSALTFGGVRTNLLQGAVHLVLFFVYLVLIFQP